MPSPLPASWNDRIIFDRAHAWHPFTQEKEHEAHPPVPVVGAEGCDYILSNGQRVLDGISSWWCNLHGHGHPRIVEALSRQAAKLDHIMFAGFTHEPALELLARLRQRLPEPLTRCFFSDNGSTAIEIALKMAFQAQLQKGQKQRTRFGALREGYHGDTLGAVGVGELDNWLTGIFKPLLMACDRVEVPEDARRELGPTALKNDLNAERQKIREFFKAHGEQMAAFIAEPLVQGAGGMRFWAPELLQEIRQQCTHHGVYLILDEVMTGFGRTGTFLALEQCNVKPDFLCLSKGLTNGTLPLALTWTTEEVYGQFWGEITEGRTFFHGHTYTANPLACSVACANLDIFESEPVMERAQALTQHLANSWQRVQQHPAIRRARTLGCIAAAHIVDPKTGLPYPTDVRINMQIHRKGLEKGLLIRPMGDCLYLMPPLATPLERVETAIETILELLPS